MIVFKTIVQTFESVEAHHSTIRHEAKYPRAWGAEEICREVRETNDGVEVVRVLRMDSTSAELLTSFMQSNLWAGNKTATVSLPYWWSQS